MGGTNLKVRELRIEDFTPPPAIRTSGQLGLAYLAGIPLPALLRDTSLRDNEELLRFCLENDPLRFERSSEGDIRVMTPAGSKTGKLELYVGRKLDEWAERDGNGTAFGPSAGFSLPDSSVLSPDASWIALSRWNALAPSQQDGFAPLCPDFVVEIASPGDRDSAVEAEMDLWINNGAQLSWMIDRKRKIAGIYRPHHELEILQQPEFLDGEGILVGFRLEMKPFWA